MEKKNKVIISLLLIFSLLFSKEIRVCKTCEINSIKKAIEIAENGDTIIVEKGIYREGTININKQVKIIGINYPTIDGEKKYEVVQITANNVHFEGFRIINSGVSEIEDLAGIKVKGVKNCVIRRNILENNFWGIYLANVRDCIVEENKIVGNYTKKREVYSGNGIHLWHCKRIVIRKNKVIKHRDGIYFEFVTDSLIAENLSKDNWRYGLHFMFSHRDTYVNNTFINNGAGVAVMYTKKVIMIHNKFYRNWGSASYGLLLKALDDSVIMYNKFIKNTVGILIDESQRSKILYNDFIENGWALRIFGSSMGNVISKNNFIGNTFDVTTNTRRSFNTIEMNYWSSYKGFDLNRDGIGDIPYKPVKLFSYIVENNPAAVILLKSFFVELLNYIEDVFPAVISIELQDKKPLMRKVKWKF